MPFFFPIGPIMLGIHMQPIQAEVACASLPPRNSTARMVRTSPSSHSNIGASLWDAVVARASWVKDYALWTRRGIHSVHLFRLAQELGRWQASVLCLFSPRGGI